MKFIFLDSKPLDRLTETDLTALVDGQVPEGRAIDYKLMLPGTSDDDKREFLADVSSLANMAGGHLFYGIEEEAGVAVTIVGVSIPDEDKEKQRLENLLASSVQPRIPNVGIRAVPLANGATVLVVRVPRNFARPHMVTFKNLSRFYARNSAGKYQMDVFELRTAFQNSDITERVRRFRRDRLDVIEAGELPTLMESGAKLVVQVVPLESLELAVRRDVLRNGVELFVLGSSGWNWRINLDGKLWFSTGQSGTYSYVQLFHSGQVEGVASLGDDGEKLLQANGVEIAIIDALQQWLGQLQSLEVQPPAVVMLSVLGAKGYSIPNNIGSSMSAYRYVVDRDVLLLPDVLLESFDIDVSQAMRPAFNALWNAAGRKGSPNYDATGNWKRPY